MRTALSLAFIAGLAGCVAPRQARPDTRRGPAKPPAPRVLPPAASPVKAAAPGRVDTAEEVVKRALKQHAALDSYQCRMTRRDTAKKKPTEVLLFKYRREPLSVHFRWISKNGRGRQVLWVRGKYNGKLQIRLARGDVPLMPAGKVMRMSPDSMLVRAQSPHHITEAGMCGNCQDLARKLKQHNKNPEAGWLKYLGRVKRPEYPDPMHAVEVTYVAGEDGQLKKGGRRRMFFATRPGRPSFGLPVITLAYDHAGREVEYFCLDRFLYPIRLDDRDFDPDFLWKKR